MYSFSGEIYGSAGELGLRRTTYLQEVSCAPGCLYPVPSPAASLRSLRRTGAGSRTLSAHWPWGWTCHWSLSRCPSRPRTAAGVCAPSAGGSACTSLSPGSIWWTSPISALGTSSCTPCGSSCWCSSFGLELTASTCTDTGNKQKR